MALIFSLSSGTTIERLAHLVEQAQRHGI